MTPTDEQVEAAMHSVEGRPVLDRNANRRGVRLNDGGLLTRETMRAALTAAFSLAAPAGTAELDEDIVMIFLRKNFDTKSVRALTYTSWKDSLDIERVSGSTMSFVKDIVEASALLPPQPSAVLLGKDVGPVGPTYYDEGKDAGYFEALGNPELAKRLSYAAMDIADGDFGVIESYMPVCAMLSLAANRLAALVSQPQPEGEAVDKYLGDSAATDEGSPQYVDYLHPAPTLQGAGWIEAHKLDTDKQVFFYEQDFYVLSNFSSFSLNWRGLSFPTSEHAYHWEKFDGVSLSYQIRVAPSAHEAFKLAEANKGQRVPDWDQVKVGIMRDILRAKADQHEYVRRKLLATGDRELVEDSWRDDFWGWGPNRDGQNMLGKLWMEVRAELRAALSPQRGAGK